MRRPGSISKHFLPYTEPKRGDIIVFRYPMDISQNYVKRLMGMPGDHLKVDEQGPVLERQGAERALHSARLPRTSSLIVTIFLPNLGARVYDRAKEMLRNNVVNGEIVVPPGSYFAMGDNRDNSLDSRYWGFVPRENIIGKPLLIFWSYDAPTEDLGGLQCEPLYRSGEEFLFQDALGTNSEAGSRRSNPVRNVPSVWPDSGGRPRHALLAAQPACSGQTGLDDFSASVPSSSKPWTGLRPYLPLIGSGSLPTTTCAARSSVNFPRFRSGRFWPSLRSAIPPPRSAWRRIFSNRSTRKR